MKANILIGGDLCPQERAQWNLLNGKEKYLFGETADLIRDASFSIINLECPVFSDTKDKISKVGRNLCSDKSLIPLLKETNVNLVTLANNHFMDYGSNGARLTLSLLKEHNIEHIGAGENLLQAAKPYICNIGDKRIGIINACETEFSIASEADYGCNPIDIVSITMTLQDLQKQADQIILILHGGNEHYSLPSPRMKRLYHYFLKMGADFVVNHHQHCVSGWEEVDGKYIFYGLGNLCFDRKDQRNSIWNIGCLLNLDFNEDDISFSLIPYEQYSTDATIKLLQDEDKEQFFNNISNLNCIIQNDHELNKSYLQWINKNRNRYLSYLSPYQNKYIRFLCRKNIIPRFLNKQKRNVLFDMIKCESHNDIITYLLKE